MTRRNRRKLTCAVGQVTPLFSAIMSAGQGVTWVERPEVQQTTSRKIDNLLAVIIVELFLETGDKTKSGCRTAGHVCIFLSLPSLGVCVCPAILPTCGGLSVPVPPSLWRCIYTVPAMAMIMRCVTTRAGGRTGNLSHELNLAPLCHAQLLVPRVFSHSTNILPTRLLGQLIYIVCVSKTQYLVT